MNQNVIVMCAGEPLHLKRHEAEALHSALGHVLKNASVQGEALTDTKARLFSSRAQPDREQPAHQTDC